jgi:hypothetical protein
MRIRHCVSIVFLGSALLSLAACNRVGDDWKSAQAADTSESYQLFLQQHQDSEFATKAQERIRQLAEDREWQAASGQDTQEGYQQFLAQHAESKWAQEARARIENFQQAETAVAAPAIAATAPAVVSGPAPEPTALTAPAKVAVAKPATRPIRVATVSGTHYAQLGAFSSRERAEREWQTLHTRLGAELGSLQPHYSTGKSGSQLLYRLQVGVASAQQLVDLCARLKKRSQACIPSRG